MLRQVRSSRLLHMLWMAQLLARAYLRVLVCTLWSARRCASGPRASSLHKIVPLLQVEASQTMIRVVGLSATLPNYADVAQFLGVSPNKGLFHFGPEFRPVPLAMNFIGVTEKNVVRRNLLMIDIVFDKVLESLRGGNQCMVFVHSRKDTAKTGEQLADVARARGLFHGHALESNRT
jgi:replicative superfamily II helicase